MLDPLQDSAGTLPSQFVAVHGDTGNGGAQQIHPGDAFSPAPAVSAAQTQILWHLITGVFNGAVEKHG